MESLGEQTGRTSATEVMSRDELAALMDPASYLKYVDEIYRQCGLIA